MILVIRTDWESEYETDSDFYFHFPSEELAKPLYDECVERIEEDKGEEFLYSATVSVKMYQLVVEGDKVVYRLIKEHK